MRWRWVSHYADVCGSVNPVAHTPPPLTDREIRFLDDLGPIGLGGIHRHVAYILLQQPAGQSTV